MSYSSVILGDSPSYYWQLQETSGTTATDSAGTNTGTYHTGFTLGQQAPPMGGTSVLFNGSSGYMSTAQTIANDSTTFSIELWFNSTAKNVPLAMIANPGQGDAIVGLNSSGNLVGSVANSTESAWNDTTTTGVYSDGKWHHAVYTVSSSSASIYVDGALNKTTTGITVDASAGRNNTWALAYNISGSHSYGTYASGYFAHFAVWNTTALTATQVSNHYNTATGGSGPTPITATGAFQGQGSLSATANIVNPATINATASFTGQGSLTATANLISPVVASANFQGQGSLTATGNGVWLGSASLTGQGSLSSNPVVVLTASASLSGQGSLTAVVELQDTSVIGTANFYGSSSVVSNPTVSKAPILATANMQGQGSLTATVEVIDIGVANLQGTSYLMANAVLPSQVQVPKVWNVVFDPKKSWTGVFDKTVHTWTGVFDPKKVWVGGE